LQAGYRAAGPGHVSPDCHGAGPPPPGDHWNPGAASRVVDPDPVGSGRNYLQDPDPKKNNFGSTTLAASQHHALAITIKYYGTQATKKLPTAKSTKQCYEAVPF